mmetsp:Transcript_6208/g.11038  ORF Transcript_6208/g.11038 Transcript_6208/m.11038 type:complete len:180 (-) Transcript_6208:49-588(-)
MNWLKDNVLSFANNVFTGRVGASSPRTDEARKEAIDAMYAAYKKKAFSSVSDLSADEFGELLRGTSNILCVDTREPRERDIAALPGSIPASEFDAEAAQASGKLIVAYCTVGYRSGLFCRNLVREHPELNDHVKNLAGGILSWCHAGQPVVDAQNQTTQTVNVYGKAWDLLPDGHVGVW